MAFAPPSRAVCAALKPLCRPSSRLLHSSALVLRSHPLSSSQGPQRPTASAQPEQKWSSKTLIVLASFVGAVSYSLARAQSPSPAEANAASTSTQLATPNPTQADFDAALGELCKVLPEDCFGQDDVSLAATIPPWSYHNPIALPGAVLYPRSTADVQAIVRLASQFSIPLIPFCGLTSLEGHVNAPDLGKRSAESTANIAEEDLPHGLAWAISFSENMNGIVQLHKDDLDVVVQPGMPYEALNEELKQYNLFFPVDPGPGAQIGGMVGTGASGTNAVRYGTMRENILFLTVVQADGTVIKTRQRAKKSSAGPNLGQLFIGSEGTLGIVTEICLRLQPLLPYTVAVASFPDVSAAATCVRDIVQSGIQVQCVELMDEPMVKCTNAYAKSQPDMRQWPEQPALFLKFSGNDKQLANDIDRTTQLVKQSKGGKLVFAQSEKEKDSLWYSRKVALWSALDYRPGSKCIVTDVCVPISKLPEMVRRVQEDLEQLDLMGPIVGHAGDGNLHALILFDNEEEKKRAKEAVHRMVATAQELDGTCTGEHGVGIGKKSSLEAELGPGTIELLKRIKSTMDPKGILNPFKLYP